MRSFRFRSSLKKWPARKASRPERHPFDSAEPITTPLIPKHPESQGPEEMCLSLDHQNPSKTFEKMGYFDRVTVSLHILLTANQETEGSQDRLTV